MKPTTCSSSRVLTAVNSHAHSPKHSVDRWVNRAGEKGKSLCSIVLAVTATISSTIFSYFFFFSLWVCQFADIFTVTDSRSWPEWHNVCWQLFVACCNSFNGDLCRLQWQQVGQTCRMCAASAQTLLPPHRTNHFYINKLPRSWAAYYTH